MRMLSAASGERAWYPHHIWPFRSLLYRKSSTLLLKKARLSATISELFLLRSSLFITTRSPIFFLGNRSIIHERHHSIVALRHAWRSHLEWLYRFSHHSSGHIIACKNTVVQHNFRLVGTIDSNHDSWHEEKGLNFRQQSRLFPHCFRQATPFASSNTESDSLCSFYVVRPVVYLFVMQAKPAGLLCAKSLAEFLGENSAKCRPDGVQKSSMHNVSS
jgi:hypothetical protein